MRVTMGQKRARNPWAVCRAAAKGRRWTRRKLERCVKKVKARSR